jgi:hypothetical protein
MASRMKEVVDAAIYAAGGGIGVPAHLAQSVTPRKVQMRQMNVPHCAHG